MRKAPLILALAASLLSYTPTTVEAGEESFMVRIEFGDTEQASATIGNRKIDLSYLTDKKKDPRLRFNWRTIALTKERNTSEIKLTVYFPDTNYAINRKRSGVSADGKIWYLYVKRDCLTPAGQSITTSTVAIPEGIEQIVYGFVEQCRRD